MNLWLAAKSLWWAVEDWHLRLAERYGRWYFYPLGEDKNDRCEMRRCFTHWGAMRMARALQEAEDSFESGGSAWVTCRWPGLADPPRESAREAARLSAKINEDVLFLRFGDQGVL